MTTPVLHLTLPCPKCKAAPGDPCLRRDGEPAARPHGRRTPPAPCGTFGGYQRHIKAKEPACDGCAEASRKYMAEYRRKNPDRHAKDLEGLRAVNRATSRLVDLHRDEWRSLVAEEKAS